MPKRRNKISKSTETAQDIWHYATQADFTNKSNEVAERRLRSRIELRDHVWFLGYENADLLYRRKRLLDPLTVEPRTSVDGTPTASTNTTAFALPGFDIRATKLPEVAGCPTQYDDPAGFAYSSDSLTKIVSAPRPHIKRHYDIFLLPSEQCKRTGIQTFRDYPGSQPYPGHPGYTDNDRMVLHRKIDGGLTIPVAGE
ncbi:hypothetical protein BC831DRAFT_19244 [Entophlyctis helioformis]|nr:hypothetical protein BC831DRAFT_19244 [Entophlyctis helioformis]